MRGWRSARKNNWHSRHNQSSPLPNLPTLLLLLRLADLLELGEFLAIPTLSFLQIRRPTPPANRSSAKMLVHSRRSTPSKILQICRLSKMELFDIHGQLSFRRSLVFAGLALRYPRLIE